MKFVKKLLTYLIFVLGVVSLLLYITLYIGSFWQAEPSWWTLFVVILGVGLGILSAQHFLNQNPKKRRALTLLGILSFVIFSAMVGLIFGATLGGNGIVDVEFAGLIGYESAGLIFAILGSVLGTYIAYRVLEENGLPALWTITACLLGAGIELLIGFYAWISSGGPYLASLFLPLGLILLFGWLKRRLHSR